MRAELSWLPDGTGMRSADTGSSPAAQTAGSAENVLACVPPPALPGDAAGILDGEPAVVKLPTAPEVSIIVPVKNSQRTIRSTVEALLAQNYPALAEVIVVGDVDDQTWHALQDVADPRLVIIEHDVIPGKREPSAKRDVGLRKATGEILALVDSDIKMDADWLSRAVTLLTAEQCGVVCGGMRAVRPSFWSRFVDANTLAAKTPRVPRSYRVTADNFGKHGRKPPITANVIMFRDVYDDCQIDDTWGFGYEDYEWFWRVARRGHEILYAAGLDGAHHHRQSFRRLAREYQVSAQGCAHFIRAYPDSPLARKRRQQAVLLPLAAVAAVAGAVTVVVTGHGLILLAAVPVAAVGFATREVVLARRLEAVGYVVAGLALGALFVVSLSWRLARPAPGARRRRSNVGHP
jgi:GT2 family glycosyltransferase